MPCVLWESLMLNHSSLIIMVQAELIPTDSLLDYFALCWKFISIYIWVNKKNGIYESPGDPYLRTWEGFL